MGQHNSRRRLVVGRLVRADKRHTKTTTQAPSCARRPSCPRISFSVRVCAKGVYPTATHRSVQTTCTSCAWVCMCTRVHVYPPACVAQRVLHTHTHSACVAHGGSNSAQPIYHPRKGESDKYSLDLFPSSPCGFLTWGGTRTARVPPLHALLSCGCGLCTLVCRCQVSPGSCASLVPCVQVSLLGGGRGIIRSDKQRSESRPTPASRPASHTQSTGATPWGYAAPRRIAASVGAVGWPPRGVWLAQRKRSCCKLWIVRRASVFLSAPLSRLARCLITSTRPTSRTCVSSR